MANTEINMYAEPPADLASLIAARRALDPELTMLAALDQLTVEIASHRASSVAFCAHMDAKIADMHAREEAGEDMSVAAQMKRIRAARAHASISA